jgi:hypothetical protein
MQFRPTPAMSAMNEVVKDTEIYPAYRSPRPFNSHNTGDLRLPEFNPRA